MTRSFSDGSYALFSVTRQQSPSSLQTIAADATPVPTVSAVAAMMAALVIAFMCVSILVDAWKRGGGHIVRIEQLFEWAYRPEARACGGNALQGALMRDLHRELMSLVAI